MVSGRTLVRFPGPVWYRSFTQSFKSSEGTPAIPARYADTPRLLHYSLTPRARVFQRFSCLRLVCNARIYSRLSQRRQRAGEGAGEVMPASSYYCRPEFLSSQEATSEIVRLIAVQVFTRFKASARVHSHYELVVMPASHLIVMECLIHDDPPRFEFRQMEIISKSKSTI